MPFQAHQEECRGGKKLESNASQGPDQAKVEEKTQEKPE